MTSDTSLPWPPDRNGCPRLPPTSHRLLSVQPWILRVVPTTWGGGFGEMRLAQTRTLSAGEWRRPLGWTVVGVAVGAAAVGLGLGAAASIVSVGQPLMLLGLLAIVCGGQYAL